jgi:hypothetical protein
MVALTIAPIIKNKEEWDTWYFGMIPIALMLIGTFLVYYFFWRHCPVNIVENRVLLPTNESTRRAEETEPYIPPLL